MDKITEKVVSFLQDGMEKTMRSYEEFTDLEKDKSKSEEFQKYHMACKQAVSHLESLLALYSKNKLVENEKDYTQKDIKSLVDEACIRIQNDNKNHK